MHHPTIKHSCRRKGTALAAVALLVACGLTPPTQALDINLSLDPFTDVPAFDSTLSEIITLMDAAADHWENIIEDSHTLDITFGWDNIGPLGAHTLNSIDPLTLRETEATIQFDTSVSWFFDDTPEDDSEFAMGQTLFRPAVGGVVEQGYAGTASGTSPAVGSFDFFTVALHEIGHALGMSAANGLTVLETADGDYDAPADLYDGTSVVISAAGSDIAHLSQQNSLMGPSVAPSTRKLPSAIDVMAMSAAQGWSDIDLNRQDFIAGSASFNTASHWIGNSVPDADDLAYVRDAQTAKLKQSDVTVAELIIDEVSKVEVGELTNSILTANNMQVQGGSKLRVFAAGSVNTDTLLVGQRDGNRGEEIVTVTGGFISANEMEIEYTGTLRGHGTVVVDTIKNNGKIRAYDGTLTLAAFDWLDLDGPNALGVVEAGLGGADSGDLIVNGPVNPFAGRMWVREGSSAEFDHDWTITDLSHLGGSRGALYLDDGGDIRGSGTITVSGDMVVNRPDGVDAISSTFMEIDVTSIGTLDVRGDASLSLVGGANILDGATVTGGGNVSIPWYASANGLTTDEDMDVHVTNGGNFSLGGGLDYTENVTVDAFTQTDSGTFFIELGGTTPSTGEDNEPIGSHDQLVVDNEVELDGIMEVGFVDGFEPSLGDEFHVMVYDDLLRSGEFDDIVHPSLLLGLLGPAGIPMYLTAHYEDDGLWLRTGLFSSPLGSATLKSPAMLNPRASLLYSKYSLGDSLSASAVPEPSTVSLALLVLFGTSAVVMRQRLG